MWYFYRHMKKHFLPLILISFIFSCSDQGETKDPVSSDISVISSQTRIIYTDQDDLESQVDQSLSFNFGTTPQSQIDQRVIYASDNSLVSAFIDFKSAYEDDYYDPNPSNNSTIINLQEYVAPPEAAVVLSADGPGETYELITSVLAPNNSPVEAPDCNHEDFGRHIDEIYDNFLQSYVFRFMIHVAPDNDRCINFDRQRNEIKTYDKSPENLLGRSGETVQYKWKFKLADGFQPSPKFTHIHQLKSVGGNYESMPMYTLTVRKSDPDRIELRYAETDSQTTLDQTDLAPFIGVWVEVTETITYGEADAYSLVINDLENNATLFEYSTNSIDNWRPDGLFVRPKWGIYRSLDYEEDLRDEDVLFADFSIQEL